eukprot:1155746-Pelagomonas_calceolata.AAC.7
MHSHSSCVRSASESAPDGRVCCSRLDSEHGVPCVGENGVARGMWHVAWCVLDASVAGPKN